MQRSGARIIGIVGAVAAFGSYWLLPMAGAESPGVLQAQRQAATARPAPSAVPAYAPAGSQAEAGIVDAAQLLGIPLVQTPRFPSTSPVAFFSTAALADRQLVPRLRAFVTAGGRALVTSRLASRLGRLPSERAEHIFILPSTQGAASVLGLPQAQVDGLRNFVLHPLGLRMEAPPRVALRLIGSDGLV